MKVLVACEYSGIVRDAFTFYGHEAISCDLLPTERPGLHYQGDVLDILNADWDLIIAHPDCTYLTNSGVCWLYRDPERLEKLQQAARFFRVFLEHPCPKKAIENPIPHKYALTLLGKSYTQLIQPWMFGHAESKATCLWLTGLPKLVPTTSVQEEMRSLPKAVRNRVSWLSRGPTRAKERSRTFPGIALAMAQQWGGR